MRAGPPAAIADADVQAAPGVQERYTRTAQNGIHRQFHRLPNLTRRCTCFPHLAGTDWYRCPATARCSRSTSACGTRCRASAWRITDGLVAAVVTQAQAHRLLTPWMRPMMHWARHVGRWRQLGRRQTGQGARPWPAGPATQADHDGSMASRRRSWTCCPGSVPARHQVHVAGRWIRWRPSSKLAPVGTEGREWRPSGARCAGGNALQDSFDELDA